MNTTTSTGTLRIAAGSAAWRPQKGAVACGPQAGSYTWNDWGPQAGSSCWELPQAGAASWRPQAGATAWNTPRAGASAWR